MQGYWRNDEANAAAFVHGFLRTGDVGLVDARGRLPCWTAATTRSSAAAPMSTRARSRTLTRHPAVKEAAAFGLPDRSGGKRRGGGGVARRIAGVDAASLIAFCRDHLASFKKPKRIEFVSELPKNAYGKVLRRELRDRFNSRR